MFEKIEILSINENSSPGGHQNEIDFIIPFSSPFLSELMIENLNF